MALKTPIMRVLGWLVVLKYVLLKEAKHNVLYEFLITQFLV